MNITQDSLVRTNRIQIIWGNLLVELAHMIMKAEKYHKRLFASWICLDSGRVAQSKSKGLRTMVADGVTLSLVQRLGNLEELLVQVLESKTWSLMSSGKRRRCPTDRGETGNCLSLSSIWAPCQLNSNTSVSPNTHTHTLKTDLSQFTNSHTSLLWKHTHRWIWRNNALSIFCLSLNPVKLTPKINHYSMRLCQEFVNCKWDIFDGN